MSFHLGLYQYYTANFSGLSENVYDFAKCRLAHYHRKKSESIKICTTRNTCESPHFVKCSSRVRWTCLVTLIQSKNHTVNMFGKIQWTIKFLLTSQKSLTSDRWDLAGKVLMEGTEIWSVKYDRNEMSSESWQKKTKWIPFRIKPLQNSWNRSKKLTFCLFRISGNGFRTNPDRWGQDRFFSTLNS